MSLDRFAHTVDSNLDYQHGEGWLTIQWSGDPTYGNEGLTIDFDGHCSRNMPIRSGQGPPEFVDLTEDRIHLRFSADLADRLELPIDFVVGFKLNATKFAQLKLAVDFFRGDYF